MKKNTLIVVLVVVALIAAGAVSVALWRGNTEPAATDAHLHHDDPRVADPTTAATGTLTALLTWQPSEQEEPWESAAAISDRLTGRLADYAASEGGNEPLPRNWEAWAQGGDRIQGLATVSPDSKDIPEQATTATVTVDVEQRVWHPSGDMTPLTKGVVDVSLELIDDEWMASDYSYLSVEY